MGWNGSNDAKSGLSNLKPPVSRTHRSVVWSAAAGAVVVLTGAISAWFFLNRGEPSDLAQNRKSARGEAIPEAVPAVPIKCPKVERPKKYADLTRDEKLAYYRDKYGDNLPENLKPIVYYLENPPQRTFTMPKRPESIFKHHSERTIAAFLMVEPGSWMMKPVEFSAKFDADLGAALAEEIEFCDDDTDEQRELKEAVIETKNELAERIKNGEKASEILSETSRQLYELGKYKSDLAAQIAEIRRDSSMSDQDVKDAVDAANKMLKDKGLPPLKMPNMLVRHASLKRAARKAAEKAAAEAKKEK